MYSILMVVFVIDVVLLIPVILMQSGSGADAGMFGGDITMGAFGAKTSEVLVKFTKWLVTIFMVTAFFLGFIKIQETKIKNPNQRQNIQPTEQPVSQPTDELPTEQPTEDASAETESAQPADESITLPIAPADDDTAMPPLPIK